jgi:hypothetical protein
MQLGRSDTFKNAGAKRNSAALPLGGAPMVQYVDLFLMCPTPDYAHTLMLIRPFRMGVRTFIVLDSKEMADEMNSMYQHVSHLHKISVQGDVIVGFGARSTSEQEVVPLASVIGILKWYEKEKHTER